MTPETRPTSLLKAVRAFDLPAVEHFVRQGQRDGRAFLSDQENMLPEGDDDTIEILAQLSKRGVAVETENQALFELYETMILAGHPVPDGSVRRCLIRVIAGADQTRHERARRLMDVCNEQGMLSWAGSEWAAASVARINENPEALKIMMPTPTSNDLFADAVSQAASAGNLELLQYLCCDIPPGIKGKGDNSVLVDISLPTHKAAMQGHLECLQYLLTIMREDQWKKSCPSTMKYTPLLCAAASGGQAHVVNWLLDNGVDINEIGENGVDALGAAADAKVGVDMARLLLDRGIDPNGGGDGPHALNFAIWHMTPGVAELLLERGTDPNYIDGMRSPVMLSAMMGDENVVRGLIARGALLDHQDEQGMTAVAWAIKNKREGAFLALYEAGADLTLTNSAKMTAYDHAEGAIKSILDQKLISASTPTSRANPRTARI